MTVVKASKEYQWRVVKYNPRLPLLVSLFVIVLFVVFACGIYFIGHRGGVSELDQTQTAFDLVQAELVSLRSEKLKFSQELENIKLGGEIDQKSLEQVRLEVLELRSTIAALEEDNQFYRNLMAPTENKRGLTFGSIEIAATEQLRTYHIKVVMQQLAASHELLNGSLNINIIGRENGEVKVLTLSDVSKDINAVSIKLRFKYFQNVEAELVLPEMFEPERIELEARSTGKKPTTIEKRLAWLVQEA